MPLFAWKNKTTHTQPITRDTHVSFVGRWVFFSLSIVYSRCLSLSSSKMKISSFFAHQPREVKFFQNWYSLWHNWWEMVISAIVIWPLHSFGNGQLALKPTSPRHDSGASTGQKLTKGSIGGISQFWRLRVLKAGCRVQQLGSETEHGL